MSLINNYQSLIDKGLSPIEFMRIFSDADECLDLYFNLKYSGKDCPKCGRNITQNYVRISRPNKNGTPKKAYRCRSCHTFIYPMANSIFRQSTIPLPAIFDVLFMMCSARSSMSAIDVTTQIGISYKTAHKLMMLIRVILYSAPRIKMKGILEVDEAFLGTGSKIYNWSGISTRKQPIIGIIERDTKKVRVFLVQNRKAVTIEKLVEDNIEKGSTIYTDSWRGYNGLSSNYTHESVDHSKREFVRGDVHTNAIENFWGQVKRNLRKAHIKISDKYVHLYLNEAAWRHNSKGRKSMELFNEVLISSFSVFDCTIT